MYILLTIETRNVLLCVTKDARNGSVFCVPDIYGSALLYDPAGKSITTGRCAIQARSSLWVGSAGE
jgi:hypothetical protein